jgi:peptidoglycan hydrolase-like protein with peptidoglycan-binding domain
VRAYQRTQGMRRTGIVTPAAWERLQDGRR